MFKNRTEKAAANLKLQDALKRLLNDLNALGALPGNVECKDIYDPYFGGNRKLPVPKDTAMYDYALSFFNIIARFQDSDIMKNELLADNKSFEILKKHISNAGRNSYGWVRSERGQPVTADNVFLGDVYGIWTKPMRTFKEMPDDEWLQWVIQEYQLRGFLRSHIEPMKQILADIITTEQKNKKGFLDGIFNSYIRGKGK